MTDSSERRALAVPRLHIVTDTATLLSPTFAETAAALLAAGGPRIALHLRGPGLGGRLLWRLAEACAVAAARGGARLVINDRLDVARAVGAWGAQLGHRSFEVLDARRLLPSSAAIGVSIHDPTMARSAAEEGADFILAGTLYASASHPESPGTGVQWLSSLTDGPPIIGIGGVTPGRIPELLAAGAHGAAVIRGVWARPSPVTAMEEYLKELAGK